MRVVIGIGCDRGTSLETLETALDQALEMAGIGCSAIATLASIDKKRDEVCLIQLAAKNSWPLIFFSARELAQVDVPNPSEVVRKYMGTPSVGEAAALLAGRAEPDQLIIEKHKYRGADDRNATISVVRVD